MKIISIWLQKITGIPSDLIANLFSTLTIILILWLVRLVVLKAVWRRTENSRLRYQWRKTSNYTVSALAILLIGRVWYEGFQPIATFLGLLSAGLAIALKDPLTNVAGWFFVLWRRPFDVGDRIQIGAHAGDVIDIRIFQFTLMEIGNWVHADQCTGRIIHVPNGKVFVEPQINYTRGWFDYIWNEVPVLVTFESDWKKAKEILQRIAITHAGDLTSLAEQKVKQSAREFVILTTNFAPAVFTSVEDSGVLLTLRHLCDPRGRRDMNQLIWESVLDEFAEHDDIDLAYATIRYYRIPEEIPAAGCGDRGGAKQYQ